MKFLLKPKREIADNIINDIYANEVNVTQVEAIMPHPCPEADPTCALGPTQCAVAPEPPTTTVAGCSIPETPPTTTVGGCSVPDPTNPTTPAGCTALS